MTCAPTLPGGTLGVLGGGQLGRMFAIAARRMGYRVHVLSPDDDTPTGQVADREIRAAYDDLDQVAVFARGVDVVTFEFENVPSATVEVAAKHAPVRPAGRVLHVTQNRQREKTFLADAGLPVTPFAPVADAAQLRDAVERLGLPAVLKSAAWGYDGKGQFVIRTVDQVDQAWGALQQQPCILETFIDFDCELSVVAARSIDGQVEHFGPIGNTHANHILDISIVPAPVDDKVQRDAVDITRSVMQKLDVVGVLCVEFFLSRDGQLMINELAPRPHNSGHLTIDAHVTCQFEQQVRAVCGLALGSTRLIQPAAMVNLLGDLWQNGEPHWQRVCKMTDVKLHLYGKRDARPGRKMGHLTVLGDTAAQARERALRARQSLCVAAGLALG